MRCASAVRSRMPRERWASRANCVRWSVMARIAAISGNSSTSTRGAREGTTCGAHRRPGRGFTTVGEPAKQLPSSRVVRVGDQLGFQPIAINPMTSDVSQHPRAQCTVGPPLASHIPVILDREGEPRATLLGHLARANPHWRLPEPERPIFETEARDYWARIGRGAGVINFDFTRFAAHEIPPDKARREVARR
jgi:hypothetical protein